MQSEDDMNGGASSAAETSAKCKKMRLSRDYSSDDRVRHESRYDARILTRCFVVTSAYLYDSEESFPILVRQVHDSHCSPMGRLCGLLGPLFSADLPHTGLLHRSVRIGNLST